MDEREIRKAIEKECGSGWGVKAIEHLLSTIDGLREELSVSQGFQATKQDEIDRFREENGLLMVRRNDAIISEYKAITEAEKLRYRLAAIEKAAKTILELNPEFYGRGNLIAAVKGEKC